VSISKPKLHLRIILLPSLVPSASWCLGDSLKILGHQTKILSRYKHPFSFKADEYVMEEDQCDLKKLFKLLKSGKYLFENFDIVHFNYGSTLFDPGFPAKNRKVKALHAINRVALGMLQKVEIQILKWRRIPIFVHFQGDDAVQGDISMKIFSESIAAHVDEHYYTVQTDKLKRKRISWFDGLASGLFYVSPDMKWFLPDRAKFVPYACTKLLELTPIYSDTDTNTLRICHAPSHRRLKGTSFVEDAIRALKAQGFSIELDLVEGQTHEETIKRIRNCDILIDQLHHGWYGGVAVEAMALGKPVVCYIRDKDLQFVPPIMAQELPIIRACSQTLIDVLREILTSPKIELRQIGIQSRRFVEKWHDPVLVAKQIEHEYFSSLRPIRQPSSQL
jgi:hypothetical protein